MKLTMVAAVAALLGATPIWAQDKPFDPYGNGEEVTYRDPMTGFRVEVQGGYDRLEVNTIDGDTKYYDGADGIRYGGEIGYDVAIGSRVLLGVYAGYAGATTNRCDDVGAFTELCQRAKGELGGGVRLGVKVGEQAQFYGKVGYASMPLEFAFGTDKTTETYAGMNFGLGGEMGVGGGAFVKAELVATNFRTKDRIYEGLNFDRRHAVAGFGYRF
ncbi:outer membrane beta-barrel protein [uncultured Sphingomonas sp.]|uniref:outer membrane beta-barrel protein n=1 Tax=uncultured Sphingomonas sp. TaxID=158754 RepID=UPI0025D2CF01|nr:outer membrane beta-barrel protein [uncultured Sphingomonas sp.]